MKTTSGVPVRKTACLLAALLLLSGPLASAPLRVGVTLNYAVPADETFRQIYGSGVLQPELSLSLRLLRRGLQLRVGAAALRASGTLAPPLADAVEAWQLFLSLAPEWQFRLSPRLALAVHGGVLLVSYREEAFAATTRGAAVGFDAGASLFLAVGRRLSACLALGFARAGDRVNDLDVRLGGLRAGVGLAARL